MYPKRALKYSSFPCCFTRKVKTMDDFMFIYACNCYKSVGVFWERLSNWKSICSTGFCVKFFGKIVSGKKICPEMIGKMSFLANAGSICDGWFQNRQCFAFQLRTWGCFWCCRHKWSNDENTTKPIENLFLVQHKIQNASTFDLEVLDCVSLRIRHFKTRQFLSLKKREKSVFWIWEKQILHSKSHVLFIFTR